MMLRRSGNRRLKAPLIAFVATVAACATVDGSDPYAMWGTVEHPQGLFSLRYLADVWHAAADSTAERPVLVVGKKPEEVPEGPPVSGPTIFEFEERYRLRAGVVTKSRDLLDTVVAAERDWLELGFEVETGAPFQSAGGAEGWVVYAGLQLDTPVFVAQVFHAAGKRVVALEVWGHRSIKNPDMRLLLKSFEPASEGE